MSYFTSDVQDVPAASAGPGVTVDSVNVDTDTDGFAITFTTPDCQHGLNLLSIDGVVPSHQDENSASYGVSNVKVEILAWKNI